MNFGPYRVEIVPDAEFRLDGGAMFGVVPRALWSRKAEPDDQNRITLNANCLYIEGEGERVLIDTGMGDKWTPRQSEIYGVDRQRSLSTALELVTGRTADEVTIVINTHLHFDHAGGNTRFDENGVAVPTFSKARYFVSRAELEHAETPGERDRASYIPDNWRPLIKSGQLEPKHDDYEVMPGLRMETIVGHSRTMQCPRLQSEAGTLFGFADLVPTRWHVPLAWVMGYDLYPAETVEAKKRLLPQAAREGWICHFYHDPDAALCRIIERDESFQAEPVAGL